MAINFISSKDSNETRTMHSMRDDPEIMISYETDEFISDTDEFIFEFIFEFSVDLLYYKLHKIILNCGGSYIDSPK